MKIAAVTDDGVTISQHFGKAQYYMVLTVEDGKITAKDQRLRTNTCACGHDSGDDCHGEHSHQSAESQNKHMGMASAISDCDVILARGMGYGAYAGLKACNLEAIITDVANIEEAVGLYLQGKLDNYMEKLH